MRCFKLCLVVAFTILVKTTLGQVHELDDNLPQNYEPLEEWRAMQANQQTLSALLKQPEIIGQLLSPKQIDVLQQHISNTGNLLDLYELQSLDEFSIVDLQRLSSWVIIRNDPVNKAQMQMKHRSIYANRGDTQYSEQPFSHYQQIRYSSNSFRMGFAREIDMGESFGKAMRFDHHSAFIEYMGHKSRSIVGHYKKFQGQGLFMAQGYSRSNFRSNRIQLNPGNWVTGMADNTEYNYFQGIYHQQIIGKKLRMEAYYSNQLVDKSNTGLHRTASERKNANSNRQEVSGLGAELPIHSGLLSISTLRAGKEFYFDFQWQQSLQNKFIVLQLVNGPGTSVALAGFNALLDSKREVAMQIAFMQNSKPSPFQILSTKASTALSIKGNWIKNDSKTNSRGFYCGIYLESTPSKFNRSKRVEIQPEYIQQLRIARQSLLTFRIKQKIELNDLAGKCELAYAWLSLQQQATEKIQIEPLIHLKYEGQLRMYQSVRCQYKTGNLVAFAAIARIQASSKIPLYYSDQNLVMPGTQMAFFRSAWVYSIGFRCKIAKGLTLQSSTQFIEMQQNDGTKNRMFLQLIYRR